MSKINVTWYIYRLTTLFARLHVVKVGYCRDVDQPGVSLACSDLWILTPNLILAARA